MTETNSVFFPLGRTSKDGSLLYTPVGFSVHPFTVSYIPYEIRSFLVLAPSHFAGCPLSTVISQNAAHNSLSLVSLQLEYSRAIFLAVSFCFVLYILGLKENWYFDMCAWYKTNGAIRYSNEFELLILNGKHRQNDNFEALQLLSQTKPFYWV